MANRPMKALKGNKMAKMSKTLRQSVTPKQKTMRATRIRKSR